MWGGWHERCECRYASVGNPIVTLVAAHWRDISPQPDIESIAERFSNRQGVVGVVGLGYVGLPLSLCACEAGFRVVGFDINRDRVGHLNEGRSPLRHIGDGKIAA